MTPREIEQLVADSGGHLCARITRGEDGSLVTLDPISTPPYLANLAISAALVLSSGTALSQATSNNPQDLRQATTQPETPIASTHTDDLLEAAAPVSGTVTDIQGALVVNSLVTLMLNDHPITSTRTDGAGQFTLRATPGKYLMQVVAEGFSPFSSSIAVIADGPTISHVSLKPGTSITVNVTTTAPGVDSTTGGVLSVSYGPWYKRLEFHLRHPIAYAKQLFHDY